MKDVDVILNISGKPYQSILTIYSLLKYSKNNIHKIFIIFEKKQAFNDDMSPLIDYLKTLSIEVEIYYSKIAIGIKNLDNRWYLKYLFRFIPLFRHSIRYQYGIEKSKSKWVFISHNDMIYRKDILENYISEIGNHAGIGLVGQCWNCPASEICSGETYFQFRPTKEEIKKLYDGKEHLRAFQIIQDKYTGWPLPECRINEMATLLNKSILDTYTFPKGNIEPIGYNSFETWINFFAKLSRKGLKFKHLSYQTFAEHAIFNKNRNGHSSFINEKLYYQEEKLAKDIVLNSIDQFIESLD